jgi:beta-glucosidase/6-phospho-beta-glucosidase/beta-galactosidase
MKFIEFIKSHIKEIKLACITFVITLVVCFGGYLLLNKPEEVEEKTTYSQKTSVTYVGSKNSDKYHLPSCRWAENIKSSNKITFPSSAIARSKGYSPCKTCID